MAQFLQLTLLQLGGEKELLKKTDLKVHLLHYRQWISTLFNKSPLHLVLFQVNLASIPLCCIAGFPGTKLDLNPQSFSMVRRCNFRTKYIIETCAIIPPGYPSQHVYFPGW